MKASRPLLKATAGEAESDSLMKCAYCRGRGVDPFGIPSKLSLCQVCGVNQGVRVVRRIFTDGGLLVCQDCYEDCLMGLWDRETHIPVRANNDGSDET